MQRINIVKNIFVKNYLPIFCISVNFLWKNTVFSLPSYCSTEVSRFTSGELTLFQAFCDLEQSESKTKAIDSSGQQVFHLRILYFPCIKLICFQDLNLSIFFNYLVMKLSIETINKHKSICVDARQWKCSFKIIWYKLFCFFLLNFASTKITFQINSIFTKEFCFKYIFILYVRKRDLSPSCAVLNVCYSSCIFGW